MISTVINSLRLFKGLYNLAFSEGQLYAEQRDEFLGGVQHCIEQAKQGYSNPQPLRVCIRKPFKVLVGILMFLLFVVVLFGGH